MSRPEQNRVYLEIYDTIELYELPNHKTPLNLVSTTSMLYPDGKRLSKTRVKPDQKYKGPVYCHHLSFFIVRGSDLAYYKLFLFCDSAYSLITLTFREKACVVDNNSLDLLSGRP